MTALSTRASAGPAFVGAPSVPLRDGPGAHVRVSLLMPIVALGCSVGIPMPELLELSEATPEQLADPDGMVRTEATAGVLQRVAEALPGEALSLRIAPIVPPAAFGLLELAGQSAGTIAEMVDIVLRYARLTSTHFQAWLERQGEFVAYRVRHLASLEAIRHPVEFGIVHAHLALLRAGVERSEVVEVHFGHPPIGSAKAYVEHFGCPVHFESFGHALVLPAALLERAPKHADPVLSRSLVARLEREIDDGDDGLSRLRRSVAEHALPAQYSARAIAKRMGKSLRSLQREASSAGTTLTQLIDDVRVARASELLLDDSLSIDDVGFLVDYSERAAFSRAFKRATGRTPAEFRRAHASG